MVVLFGAREYVQVLTRNEVGMSFNVGFTRCISTPIINFKFRPCWQHQPLCSKGEKKKSKKKEKAHRETLVAVV